MPTNRRTVGEVDGERCLRNGCNGVIALRDSENCSCHMGHAPCSSCTAPRMYCPTCHWSERYGADDVRAFSYNPETIRRRTEPDWNVVRLNGGGIEITANPDNLPHIYRNAFPTDNGIAVEAKKVLAGYYEFKNGGQITYIENK